MAVLAVRQGVTLIDDADVDRVAGYRWRVVTQRSGRRYVNATWQKNHHNFYISMHRLILGVTDPSTLVDHINGDGLDNRRANLRVASQSQNQANRRHHGGSSRFKGVTWHSRSQKWQASIKVDGRSLYLGLFSDDATAAAAYDAAAREHFGDFAFTNADRSAA